MLIRLAIVASFAMMVLILASILGAIDRHERVWFVGGIALFIIAHTVALIPPTLGMALAVIGLIMAFGSAVPMVAERA